MSGASDYDVWYCPRCHEKNNATNSTIGECWNCEATRHWEYDGPEDVGDTTGDGPAVRAEMADRARRLK